MAKGCWARASAPPSVAYVDGPDVRMRDRRELFSEWVAALLSLVPTDISPVPRTPALRVAQLRETWKAGCLARCVVVCVGTLKFEPFLDDSRRRTSHCALACKLVDS